MSNITFPDKSVQNPLLSSTEIKEIKNVVNGKLDGGDRYEDLREQLNGKNLYGNPGKADFDFDNGWIVLEEGGSISTVGDVVMTNFQLPHAVKTDSTAYLHLHWVQTTETTRTITGKYRIQNNGSTPVTAWTDFTATCSDAGDNAIPWAAGGIVQVTSLANIDLTDVGLSAIIQVRLARTDAAASDDMYLLYMDMHVAVDGYGSTTLWSK